MDIGHKRPFPSPDTTLLHENKTVYFKDKIGYQMSVVRTRILQVSSIETLK